jgi:putative Ca2+/H+ antiporter (TMEM165/GDT1 family)
VLLVQLGEGKALALATALGVVLGTWIAQRIRERVRWDTGACSG